MSKLSKRLESLALLVDKKDQLVDVGCDHGLLSIYLVQNNLCKKVIASDVNQNALNSAIKNISLRNKDYFVKIMKNFKNQAFLAFGHIDLNKYFIASSP